MSLTAMPAGHDHHMSQDPRRNGFCPATPVLPCHSGSAPPLGGGRSGAQDVGAAVDGAEADVVVPGLHPVDAVADAVGHRLGPGLEEVDLLLRDEQFAPGLAA